MFEEDLTPFFNVLEGFAIVGSFYKNYGELSETTTEIDVIFDHEFTSVENGDLVHDGFKPVLYCKTEDVSTFSYGDVVELVDLTISGLFKIISKQADGTGISTLILHEI